MSILVERAFAEVTDVAVDGREIELIAVPYDRPAVVRDRLADGTMGSPYRESWRRGAFRNAVKAPNRVKLIVGSHMRRHDRDPAADVGHALELVEREDHLRARFRVTASPFGQHALAKLDDGEWRGASISAHVLRSRDEHGVKVRTLAALDHVLLTDSPQFADARVLAVRDDPASRLHAWLEKYPLASG
jgi:HK97 family phage prohead protease